MKKNENYKTVSGNRKNSRLFSYFAAFLMLSTLSIPLATQNPTVDSSSSTQIKSRAIQKAIDPATYGTDIDTISPGVKEGLLILENTATRTDDIITYSAQFSYALKDNSYLFGYYGTGDSLRPFTLVYDVTKSDNTTETRTYEFENISAINPYFGIGELLGGTSVSVLLPFTVSTSESLVFDSIYFTNMFGCSIPSGGGAVVPNFEQNYYLNASGKLNDIVVQNIDNLFDMELDSFADFGSYTMVSFAYTIDAVASYRALLGSIYNASQASINNGSRYMRYRFDAVNNSSMEITYRDGTVIEKSFNGTSSQVQLSDQGGKANFLIDNIDTNDIVHIDLKNMTFYIDIAVTSTKLTVVRSGLGKNFYVLSYDVNDTPITNITTQLIIEIAAFIAIFIIGTLVIYFYQKNKYKNDEFRRVSNKKFFKTAGAAFIAVFSLYMAIIFIAYRATALFNSTTVYNPCDIPICIFAVISIIMIGYFAKFFATMFKNYRTKKMTERLKLDEGKDDDGTN